MTREIGSIGRLAWLVLAGAIGCGPGVAVRSDSSIASPSDIPPGIEYLQRCEPTIDPRIGPAWICGESDLAGAGESLIDSWQAGQLGQADLRECRARASSGEATWRRILRAGLVAGAIGLSVGVAGGISLAVGVAR